MSSNLTNLNAFHTCCHLSQSIHTSANAFPRHLLWTGLWAVCRTESRAQASRTWGSLCAGALAGFSGWASWPKPACHLFSVRGQKKSVESITWKFLLAKCTPAFLTFLLDIWSANNNTWSYTILCCSKFKYWLQQQMYFHILHWAGLPGHYQHRLVLTTIPPGNLWCPSLSQWNPHTCQPHPKKYWKWWYCVNIYGKFQKRTGNPQYLHCQVVGTGQNILNVMSWKQIFCLLRSHLLNVLNQNTLYSNCSSVQIVKAFFDCCAFKIQWHLKYSTLCRESIS